MNPIERQILENQYAMMLRLVNQDINEFESAINSTLILLNPTIKEDKNGEKFIEGIMNTKEFALEEKSE